MNIGDGVGHRGGGLPSCRCVWSPASHQQEPPVTHTDTPTHVSLRFLPLVRREVAYSIHTAWESPAKYSESGFCQLREQFQGPHQTSGQA